MRKPTIVLVTGALLAAGALIPTAANAAQGTQPLACSDGSVLTVRVPDNHSSDMGGWSVGQVVDGGTGTGHLISVSFDFSAYDDTTKKSLFTGTQLKGGGNANHQQTATVTCSSSDTGTLGDMLDPGENPPPETSASDTVTFTLTVTAIPKP